MIPEDEDDCHDLSDAFVRYTRNKCSSEIRGGYDHHDGYYPNTIRFVENLDFQTAFSTVPTDHFTSPCLYSTTPLSFSLGFTLLGTVMDTMATNAMVTQATPKTQTILAIPGICDIKGLNPSAWHPKQLCRDAILANLFRKPCLKIRSFEDNTTVHVSSLLSIQITSRHANWFAPPW
jgi:hypothetical protein